MILEYVLLKVAESTMKQRSNIFLQEILIRRSHRRLFRRIDGLLNFTGLDEVEHAGEQQRLRFESYIVVSLQASSKLDIGTYRLCDRHL